MKKHSTFLALLILSATFGQSQTQSGQTAPGTQPNARQPLAGQNPAQPGVIINDPNQRTIPNTPNPILFGGTNQVTFGTTNPPFATTNQRTFATTNQPRFLATNQQTFVATNGPGPGTNINEAAGAVNPGAIGATNLATLSDRAFTQQLRAALARPGATQIFFPQTRSTITVINQNGVVTLQGFVANEGERRSIEERIKNTAGVTSVNNQLLIGTGQIRGINPIANPAPGTTTPGNETNRQLFNP